MLKRYAFSFCEVVVRTEKLRNDARLYASLGSTVRVRNLDTSARDDLIACLREIRAECETLDLTHTGALISFADSEIQRKGAKYNYADMLKDLDTVSYSFSTELRRNSCVRIAPEKDKYFEKEDLFGSAVSTAFGSCRDEIRNAGNCYALEQNEATVFHSMRVLERGLGALAKIFGIGFSNTNWHNVIEQVESHIRGMGPSFGADWKQKQRFYSQAAMQFMFLKDAWRNHIMHIRDVPYDEGRALSVFDHVREFMEALAKGGLAE